MARKTAKRPPTAVSFRLMLAAIVAISAVEAALAAFGMVPPVLSYSPANFLFAIARLAIVVYAGMEHAAGAAHAALRGGALFLASSLTLCVSVFAAQGIATHPILGVFALDNTLPALFAIIVLENALVGAAIAAAVAWLSGQRFFRKSISPEKK